MLLPDPAKLMCAPCQEAAENLTKKWKQYSRDGSTIPNLERQLYLWSIEGKINSIKAQINSINILVINIKLIII